MGPLQTTCIFFLALCLAKASQRQNLAQLYGTASMIDNWDWSSYAARAIDGITDGWWHSGIAHSRTAGHRAWWKLTFPKPLYVEQITVYHRNDCCWGRSTGMQVSADGIAIGYCEGGSVDQFQVGRKVREIRLNGAPRHDGFIEVAEVQAWGYYEDIKCYDSNGKEYRKGDSYVQSDGKRCTCGLAGIVCLCEGPHITCPSGFSKWTEQVTCTSECIKDPGHCSSSGDPHYKTFDGKYYDFHGICRYQAASCGDFQVNFKNIDLYEGKPPSYTERAELVYKGVTYSLASDYQATVNGQTVELPYIKTFTNGDKVQIVNNGQLEILLLQPSKGKIPAVKIRATRGSRQTIHAELWLHGSCANVTEGMCGNWNGNADDDLSEGDANSHGTQHELYDENCPTPPPPYHPCDDLGIENGREEAEAICNDLLGAPFSSCHETVSPGTNEGGLLHNCMTDVCNCFMDKSCACSQYDNYASSCIEAGVDLSNWRQDVEYCPFECPEGQTYQSAGSVPAPTCLDRSPKKEGTVRGCFCPSGQYLQEGVCVSASQCKCLYEGSFFSSGEKIRKEGECQECTCGSAGSMSCDSITCSIPSCPSGQILAKKDDLCCPACETDWVIAINPVEKVKEGQDLTFICEVHTDVNKDDIAWSKDGETITEGVSRDRLRLTIKGAQSDDGGKYTCSATKGDSASSAEFDLSVEKVSIPTTISFNLIETAMTCRARRKCQVKFKLSKEDGEINPKTVKLCKLENDQPTNCSKVGYKKKKKLYIGKIKKITESGEYVVMVPDGGQNVLSDPVRVTVV